MGIFGWIKNRFGKSKDIETPPIEEPELEPISPIRTEGETVPPSREPLPPRETIPTAPSSLEPMTSPKPTERENIEITNVGAKIDLLLTKMENLSVQNKTIEERLKAIEKALAEMRGIRYY